MNVSFRGLHIGNENLPNLNKLLTRPEYKEAAKNAFETIDRLSGDKDLFVKTEDSSAYLPKTDSNSRFTGFGDKSYIDFSIVDENDRVVLQRQMFYNPKNPDADLTEQDFDMLRITYERQNKGKV